MHVRLSRSFAKYDVASSFFYVTYYWLSHIQRRSFLRTFTLLFKQKILFSSPYLIPYKTYLNKSKRLTGFNSIALLTRAEENKRGLGEAVLKNDKW